VQLCLQHAQVIYCSEKHDHFTGRQALGHFPLHAKAVPLRWTTLISKVTFNSATIADKGIRKQLFAGSSTRVLFVQTHDRDTLSRPPHEEGTQGDKLPIAGAMSSARRGGRGRGGGVNIANASTSDAPSGPRNSARGRGNINRANTRATSRGITRGPRGGGGGGGRGAQPQSRGGRATPPPPNSARENRYGSANNATPIVQDGSLSSRFAMVCSPLSSFFLFSARQLGRDDACY